MELNTGVNVVGCTCEHEEKIFNVTIEYKDRTYLFRVTTLLTPYWDGKRSAMVTEVEQMSAHWASSVILKPSEKKLIKSSIERMFITIKNIIV